MHPVSVVVSMCTNEFLAERKAHFLQVQYRTRVSAGSLQCVCESILTDRGSSRMMSGALNALASREPDETTRRPTSMYDTSPSALPPLDYRLGSLMRSLLARPSLA